DAGALAAGNRGVGERRAAHHAGAAVHHIAAEVDLAAVGAVHVAVAKPLVALANPALAVCAGGLGIGPRAHRTAGAAVHEIARHVPFAAGGGVPVAVGPQRAAHGDEADPVVAAGHGIEGAALLAADTAVHDVVGDPDLAAILGHTVAVGVAGVADA